MDIDINKIKNCTKCKKEIEDLKIKVTLLIEANRKTESDTWEKVSNLNIRSNEILCKCCFDKFVETLSDALGEK